MNREEITKKALEAGYLPQTAERIADWYFKTRHNERTKTTMNTDKQNQKPELLPGQVWKDTGAAWPGNKVFYFLNRVQAAPGSLVSFFYFDQTTGVTGGRDQTEQKFLSMGLELVSDRTEALAVAEQAGLEGWVDRMGFYADQQEQATGQEAASQATPQEPEQAEPEAREWKASFKDLWGMAPQDKATLKEVSARWNQLEGEAEPGEKLASTMLQKVGQKPNFLNQQEQAWLAAFKAAPEDILFLQGLVDDLHGQVNSLAHLQQSSVSAWKEALQVAMQTEDLQVACRALSKLLFAQCGAIAALLTRYSQTEAEELSTIIQESQSKLLAGLKESQTKSQQLFDPASVVNGPVLHDSPFTGANPSGFKLWFETYQTALAAGLQPAVAAKHANLATKKANKAAASQPESGLERFGVEYLWQGRIHKQTFEAPADKVEAVKAAFVEAMKAGKGPSVALVYANQAAKGQQEPKQEEP